MFSICIVCTNKVYKKRQFLKCPACLEIAHRSCTDISQKHFQKEFKKGIDINWHCSKCSENIESNGHVCPCTFCHQLRMNAISYDPFPEDGNTVSEMETSQPLSPIRNPDYRASQGIEVHGMHVSSWRELDLATQLDSLHGLSEESGPSWVQPQHPEHVSHCSIDFMNLENGSDLVASPAPSITYKVNLTGSKQGKPLITALPYGWKYFLEVKPKYYTCTSKGCKGRLIVADINDTSTFKPKGIHSCSPSHAAQLNVELREGVKLLAKQRPYDDASKLVKEVMATVIGSDESRPLNGVTTQYNLAKQVHSARKDQRNKAPGKEDLLTMDLNEDQFPPDFYRWDIKVAKGDDVRRHVFFATDKGMKYLAMAPEWRIDATFKLVSPPYTQLFTIHSPLDLGGKEKQYVLGFVLMSGKRTEDYEQVFEGIVKTLEERHLEVKVKHFLLDYEIAMWQALKNVFGDGINIRGCWFHLSQAVIRKVHNVGLMGAYHAHGDVHESIKRLTVLPLLDTPKIPKTFEYLVKKVCQKYNYSEIDFYDSEKRKSKEEPAPAIIQVFQYYEDQWITGNYFSPKDWSCHMLETRTNNNLESWNGQVNKEGGNKGMHIFKLGTFLHKHTQKLESIDMRLHSWGVYSDYQRTSQKILNKKIKDLWTDYDNGLKPWGLVKRAAHICDPYIPPDVQRDITNEIAL